MRTISLAVVLVLAGSLAVGCGKSSKDKAKQKGASGDVWTGMDGEVTSKLVVKGLDASGLMGLAMKLPENAKVTQAMRISKNDPSVAEINNSMGFTIWVSQEKVDLTKRQAEIEKSSFRKWKGWVSKQPDALIYKAEGLTGGPALHFVVTRKVGGKDYRCRNATSVSFTNRKDIDQMVAACRTLRKK